MKKKIALILAAATVAMSFAGCGSKKTKGGNDDLAALKKSNYPINTETKLTYWAQQGSPIGQYSSRPVYPFTKDYTEKLGVDIDWISPAIGQEQQQFNILLASGELPDIIEWYWGDFSGGPDKAINDGYIISLNDIMSDYAPNFTKYLKDNPIIDKQSKTDSGKYYYFPGLTQYGGENDKLLVTAGYMFRSDWLTELGLEVPRTVDEWYTVLKAFKEKKGADSPLCVTAKNLGRGLSGAFGIPLGWYNDNGTVKYGYVEQGFKDFVTEMNKWYNEGLLDKNISSIDNSTVDSKLLNNQTGAVFGWIGSNMAKWLAAGKATNNKFDLTGVPYPVKNVGDTVKFATKDAIVYKGGAAITATSEHKELSAKVLDFGYSEEGHMMLNFGVEGKTYNMIDGYPTYSDLITNNPDGLSFDEALTVYTRATPRGPFVQDVRYIEQRYRLPEQKKAQEYWIEENDIDKYALPTLTPTSEESAEFSNIMNNIGTYVDEMYIKFIMGKEPISNFDNFVKQIYDYDLERAIEIYQNALKRYNER